MHTAVLLHGADVLVVDIDFVLHASGDQARGFPAHVDASLFRKRIEPLKLGGGIGAADLVGRAPAQARTNGAHRRDLHLAHRSFPCSGLSPDAVHSTTVCLHCLLATPASFSWAPASGTSCAPGCRDRGAAFVGGGT